MGVVGLIHPSVAASPREVNHDRREDIEPVHYVIRGEVFCVCVCV